MFIYSNMSSSNNKLFTLIVTSIIIVVLLNLTIPNILLPYVKPHHSHPENGIDKLNFGHKFMNLMYFFAKAPLLSSLVLTVFVAISILLGSMIKIRPSTMKSINN
jgi:hypothetical protein